MAYKELIKNFAHIREYMRQFYVYGFRRRNEYTGKSARSYDDERRRIESWLGDYMGFHRTDEGKNVFLSIDSRRTQHNPLYKAWKSRSFTDKDITLHFIIFDILHSEDIKLTLGEIVSRIYSVYLADFDTPLTFDESTLRKKLKEYISMGIIRSEKQGKTMLYSRSPDYDLHSFADVLDYFSETAPCGVLGSFLLDKAEDHSSIFTFKHHYITQTLDSEILYSIFVAMGEKRRIEIKMENRDKSISTHCVTPLKVYISCQNGRQYLICAENDGSLCPYRLDYITEVKISAPDHKFDLYRQKLADISPYIWGANLRNDGKTEKVEFTVKFSDSEEYIYRRLLRERRCGTVTLINKNTARFSAQVFDSRELVPWIRTFICRITHISFSDKQLEKSFKQDIADMYALYGLEE